MLLIIGIYYLFLYHSGAAVVLLCAPLKLNLICLRNTINLK